MTLIINLFSISNISVTDVDFDGNYTLNWTLIDTDNDNFTHRLKIDSDNYIAISPVKVGNTYKYKGDNLGVGSHTCYIEASDGKQSVTSKVFNITIPQKPASLKAELKQAKDNYDSKHADLVSIITDIISDGRFDGDTERILLESAILNYNDAYTKYHEVANRSMNSINDKKVDDAKSAFSKEVEDLNNALGNLEGTMNDAFKQGVLSDAEKISIKQGLKNIENEKTDVDAKYISLYENPDLIGEAKTNLKNSYDSYISKYNNLVLVVDNIINKDGIIDSIDQGKWNTALDEYRAASAEFNKRGNEAITSISKKHMSDAEENAKKHTLSQIEIVNEAINLKVSQDVFDKNNKTIEKKFSEINQTTENITSTVSKIEKDYVSETRLQQNSDSLLIDVSSMQNNILNNSNGFSHVDWWAVSSANLTIRTCVTNNEIKKGFHLVNGTTEGIRFSQEIPIDGETDYTIQVNCKEIQPNVLNGYRITIQDVSSNVLVDSGSITKNGVYRLHFRLPKTAYYKLGLWHNGASQVHGSVIALEDALLVKNRFDYDLPWVDNTNDKASIAIKAGQIVNKVSKDEVNSIIEQNPKSVEVAFNSINNNVKNTDRAFIVRRGAMELYNHQDLKCFSMDQDGWLNVWGLKVFGPQNPIRFTGDGDKGIEINANRDNLCYIDFSRNGISDDYTARIAQLPNNGSLLSIIGGLEVLPDVRTSSDARLELRSPTQGAAYIDFSHNPDEDFQKRIISFNGDPQLHINGGVTIDGDRLKVDRIGRNTNPEINSLYIESNIDMQGKTIYNAIIPMNAIYSRPMPFNFIKNSDSVKSSDILENIKFKEYINKDNMMNIEMDLSNIVDTSFVTMDKDANIYGDQGELLKLALKELQDLKNTTLEEIQDLKGKIKQLEECV